MKLILVLSSLLMPLSAFADECDHWTADMQEDEGGPIMTAHACSPTGNAAHEFYVTCGEGQFSLRWIPVAPKDYPPKGDESFKTKLVFKSDGKQIEKEAGYEAMDGAMATYWKSGDPFTDLLKSGANFSIEDKAKHLPSVTVTLKGSTKALEKVEKSCH
jgi:hypothetical protein